MGGKNVTDFINFVKDILMLNKNDTIYIGLTRMSQESKTSKITRKNKKGNTDIKLSDLMKRVG